MKKNRIKVIAFCLACMLYGTAQQASAQSILDQLKNVAVDAAKNSGNSNISSLVSNIIGSSTITEKDLIGTWKFNGPQCAFTSEDLLSKAGGEIAANAIEKKLNNAYTKAKLNSSNTVFTFNSDNTCTIMIAGRSFNGTYTLDTKKSKINIKGTIFSSTAYLTKNGSDLNFTFDASKLLTLIQTVGKVSKNTQLTTLSTLSKNYTGVKLGFDMKK